MKSNESGTDRGIRIVLGIILIILGWLALGNNTLGVILDIIGIILIITGITGFCLLYTLFGMSTRKKEPSA
ncbi:MAG: YgaP-like transmembrane domain [Candidatus Zixiibacteriota bacterium]